MKRLLLAGLLLVAGCQAPPPPVAPPAVATIPPAPTCRIIAGKADRRCTPGKTNPAVTQANIAATICRKGWTDTIRPPTSYTTPLKQTLIVRYGLTGPVSAYELDHLIPLSVGGDPRSVENLYPESWDGPTGAYVKDGREHALNHAVCAGRIKLADAQRQIVAEWSR